jgi:hypothetical protein
MSKSDGFSFCFKLRWLGGNYFSVWNLRNLSFLDGDSPVSLVSFDGSASQEERRGRYSFFFMYFPSMAG